MKPVKYDPKVHPDNVTHHLVRRYVHGTMQNVCQGCRRTQEQLRRDTGDQDVTRYVCPPWGPPPSDESTIENNRREATDPTQGDRA